MKVETELNLHNTSIIIIDHCQFLCSERSLILKVVQVYNVHCVENNILEVDDRCL